MDNDSFCNVGKLKFRVFGILLFFFLCLGTIEAYGQEGEKTTNSGERIGVKNVTSKGLAFSKALASKLSLGEDEKSPCYIILYNGIDQELMRLVHLGFSQASKEGGNIRGMIIGPINSEHGAETYVLYYQGFPLDGVDPIDATIETREAALIAGRATMKAAGLIESNQEAIVKIANVSTKGLAFSQALASKFSRGKGNAVILYNGIDKTLMQKVHAGLTEAAKEGASVVAMVIGPVDPDHHLETFVVYVSGTPLEAPAVDVKIGNAKKLAKAAGLALIPKADN